MKLGVANDRLAFVALIGLVLAGLVFLVLNTGIGHYALDDAYIVDHSVAGILSGHESRFVGSTPWQGVTSPAYVAAIVLLSFILPLGIAHWAVSTLSVLFLASGWYVLCRRNRLSAAMASGVVLTSLMAGMSAYQLSNGLETGMAMAALTWALVALDHKQPPIWGYVLIGFLCFIRPELAALSLICVVDLAARRPIGWSRGLSVSFAVFLMLALLQLTVSGTLLPNTLSAKTYFFAEGCRPASFRMVFVAAALRTFISGLGLFAVGFMMALTSRLRRVVLYLVVIFIAAYFFRFPGALFHNYSRYLYLLLPIAVLGWASCLGHETPGVRLWSIRLGVVVALLVLFSARSSIKFYDEQVKTFSHDNSEMAEWVARHVPKEAVVMVHDAGRISLVGEQPLIDLVGLKSPYSMDVHRRTTYSTCQREPTAIADIARHAGASYMVVTADWDRLFRLTDSLRFAGWTVERADTERGNSYYRAYRILDLSKK